MSDPVPSDQIEILVGARRHPVDHRARYGREERTIYLLHSAECVAAIADLRQCPFSLALDQTVGEGWSEARWRGVGARPVSVEVKHDRLLPRALVPAEDHYSPSLPTPTQEDSP